MKLVSKKVRFKRSLGPLLGYHVEESKSWLVVKEEHLDTAKEIFDSSPINITSNGRKHLGTVIGGDVTIKSFIETKVDDWVAELNQLQEVAKTQPHLAFAAFIHGLRHRYVYIMRTTPNIKERLKPLDKAIDEFIKTLFQGHEFNTIDRQLLSLPPSLGGMGLIIPSQMCDAEYENSINITRSMKGKLKSNQTIYDEIPQDQIKIKLKIRAAKRKENQKRLEEIKKEIQCPMKKKSIEASTENGASLWLTALPIKSNDFHLEKQAFWDAIFIRYSIPLKRLPTTCVCGAPFDIQHAMNCPRGGFIISRHNELRDLTAEIAREVSNHVIVEPTLTPLTGEQLMHKSAIKSDASRTDVAVRDFWVRGQLAYVDIRVFNPLAKSYLNQSLQSAHRKNENEKKRAYNERIQTIEAGTFTPLVFTCFGGMSRECDRFFSHAATRIAEKRNIPKSIVVNSLRAKLNFSLLRSCLLCIRGTRTNRTPIELSDIDFAEMAHNLN